MSINNKCNNNLHVITWPASFDRVSENHDPAFVPERFSQLERKVVLENPSLVVLYSF